MNIAIDIDDTIMDTLDHLMPYLAEYFNASLEDLKKQNISYLNLPDEWKPNILAFCKKYFDSVIPSTPIKPNAAECIRKIKELGHSIYVITARDTRLYTDPYKTTFEQLTANGVYFDKLICTYEKAQACAEENIDLLIDDSIANCDSVRAIGIPTLLFSSKANSHISTPLQRVHHWMEIYDLINSEKSASIF